MNYLPKRRKRERMGVRTPERVRSDGHIQWVRGHNCLVYAHPKGRQDCEGKVQAHHVRTRGAGGGDEQVVPLCVIHHAQLDSPGWSSKRFEEVYGLNMAKIAAELWLSSPHGVRYRLAHDTQGDS